MWIRIRNTGCQTWSNLDRLEAGPAGSPRGPDGLQKAPSALLRTSAFWLASVTKKLGCFLLRKDEENEICQQFANVQLP
jgi:hypothetical protein